MPSRSLPVRPNLAQLRIQANELCRSHREHKRAAAARIAAHHPRMKGQTPRAILDRRLTVADAQLVIAREYGFDTWAELKRRVDVGRRVARFTPNPRFDEAVAAMDAGDLEQLRSLIAAEPALVHARSHLEPPYHYFTGATLLHHVAGNPDRGRVTGTLGPMPKNIVDVARLLLDAGADVKASTLGANGGSVMGLLLTSNVASHADVSGPLIDLFLEYGATPFDLEEPGVLDGSLINHAPRAAEKLIEMGAKPDVLAAAALGRMDLLRALFDEHGDLRPRPRRRGKTMTGRDAIGLALLYAYVRRQPDAVDFLLEKDGNWNMIGVNNGTALHRAAWDGDLAMVERLVVKGADANNRDNPFLATPLEWARHNKQDEVIRWMIAHCALDLHEAVCVDVRDQVEARLRDDPASINRQIDCLMVPRNTPLHCAAAWDREAIARLLFEKGADPNIVAGDGRTPLDVAVDEGAAAVANLIVQHGGKRSADL